MKQIINSKHLSTLIFILSIIVSIKLLWTIISVLFLPNNGEEFHEKNGGKKLYYRVRLTNESNVIAPIKTIHSTQKQVSSMRGYKLLGLYNSIEKLVVTIEKGRKTTILLKGEKTNEGFELTGAGKNFATFTKNNESFKLSLSTEKSNNSSNDHRKTAKTSAPTIASKSNEIIEEGGTKIISRSLLTAYTQDLDKIWKDISISKHNQNGKLNGFKINFVKKGSDFEKLGLKRGDILKAINAEELNSLSAAMNFFKEINDIENLTLTVERNGKSEDIEYEIQ